MTDKNQKAKEAAAKAALEFIKDGMTVGLGTGSTANYFIDLLGRRCKQGLQVNCFATSKQTALLAQQFNIPLIANDAVISLDITIDGADEIDPKKRMIKGGGGAHLKEKIVATMSREMIVIADESKCVSVLGTKSLLPVEILPFAYQATLKHLENKGYQGALRQNQDRTLFRTDQNNYIYDIKLIQPFVNPEQTDLDLHSIPGVIETGLFINLAGRIFIGYEDGHVKIVS